MKDIRTLLLVMLSVGLVGTWVYHLYDKTQYSQRRTEVYIKDSTAVAEGIRDSLQKIYSSTITGLDIKLGETKSNADSLKNQLDSRLGEIFKLKGEIDNILKNRGATQQDMALARKKIAELQSMVADLRGQKNSMEEERKRLNDVLTQLNGEMVNLQQGMKKLDDENKILTEKVNMASVFVASEIKLAIVSVKNFKDQETSLVKKASKMVISFAVQNNVNDYDIAEIYVVITQPDGTVLRSEDVWELSTMTTFNGNKVSYSRRVKFDYQKGATRRLVFSLHPDRYQKGTYAMQLYHNGYMIGQTSATLN